MGESIRVLHVDDDADVAEVVTEFLQRENDRLTVETVTSAGEGLDRLAEREIDCIVSDYDMPGRNGIEFLETVREAYDDLPFILFTGKGSEEVASDAISAGVTDYLQKGGGTDQYTILANRIENAVLQSRAEQRAAQSEQRYSALFEHTNDAIALVEYDGETPIVRDVNPAFEALFVPPDTDVIGEDLDEVVASEERIEEARELSGQVKDGTARGGEFVRDTVEGPREFRWQAVPLESPESGAVEHSFVVYTDLTERK